MKIAALARLRFEKRERFCKAVFLRALRVFVVYAFHLLWML